MHWSLLIHDILVALVGATGLKVGQMIDHARKTWACPQCKNGRGFSITTPNKEAREHIKEEHIRQYHS